jgi:pilus assembly protein CpaB
MASGSHAPAPAYTNVLVAKADLTSGQVLAEKDIGWKDWPAEATNKSIIKETDRPDAVHQLVGAIVRVPVATGELFRDAMVSIPAKGTSAVSFEIPAGMSFVADESVDVLQTRSEASKAVGVQKVLSEIVENARVLAVGKTAMIELSPEQADIVARARGQGEISIAPHSTADRGPLNVVRFGMVSPAHQ